MQCGWSSLKKNEESTHIHTVSWYKWVVQYPKRTLRLLMRRLEPVWVKPDSVNTTEIIHSVALPDKNSSRREHVTVAQSPLLIHVKTFLWSEHKCRRSDYMEADRAASSKHWSKSALQNHSHCWVNRKQRFSCGGKNKLQVLHINHEKLLSVKLGLIRSKQPDKPSMTQSEPLRSSPYTYTEIFYTSTSSPDNLVEMNHLPLAKNNTKAKRPKMEKNLKFCLKVEGLNRVVLSDHATTLWIATVYLGDVPINVAQKWIKTEIISWVFQEWFGAQKKTSARYLRR